MSSLSTKSAEELSRSLDEYGIKHGPIVDSTRKLYEKKLTEAMAKGTKSSSSSSDKTYYREEQEEVTYVTYHHPPVEHKGLADVTRRQRATEYEEVDHAYEPVISRTQATNYQSAPRARPAAYTSKFSLTDAIPGPAKPKGPKSGGVPAWLRVLVFVIIAAFLYYVYSNMESAEESPFGEIDA